MEEHLNESHILLWMAGSSQQRCRIRQRGFRAHRGIALNPFSSVLRKRFLHASKCTLPDEGTGHHRPYTLVQEEIDPKRRYG